MARLEIPALYRLDVGSSEWGWHKMSDLTTAVNNLLDRSPFNRMTTDEIARRFSQLNKEATFPWSDENNIDFVPPSTVPWSNPNLFVPALWSMSVILEVKCFIAKQSKQLQKHADRVDDLTDRISPVG